MNELSQAAEKHNEQERLEALLLEGLQGEESELTPADWLAIREEARTPAKARNNPG